MPSVQKEGARYRLAVVVLLTCVGWFLSSCPLRADLNGLQAEKKACLDELALTREAIELAKGAVADAGRIRAGIEKALGLYLAARDEHAKALAQIRSRLREIDVQLAKLRSPNDLADAWNAYKNNRTPEQFVRLWKAARGVPPDHATLEDYDLHARILHKEITNKVVIPVGMCLVKIGGLIKQINELAFNGVGICHPRDADGALEAVDELLGTMQKHFQKFETRFGMQDDKLLAAGVVVELSKNFQDLYDPQELLPEKLKTWAQDLGDNKYVNWIPQRAIGKLQEEAERMADEAYEQANIDLYGTTDRAGEYARYEKLRDDFAKAADESEKVLAVAQQPVDEFAKRVAAARERFDRLQATFEKLVKRQAELEKRHLDLLADIFTETKRELAKPIPGEAVAIDQPELVWESLLDESSLQGKRQEAGWLAADQATSQLLGIPNELRFGSETKVAQVMRSKEMIAETDEAGRQTTKYLTRISLGNQRIVYNYDKVRFSESTGCVSIQLANRRITGRKPGRTAVKLTVAGAGAITYDAYGHQRLETRDFASERSIQVLAVKDLEVRYVDSTSRLPVERIDLVTREGNSISSRELQFIAQVDWGHEVVSRPLDLAQLAFKVVGDPCVTVIRKQNSIVLETTNRAGECQLEVSAVGQANFTRRIRVTNSLIRGVVKMPDGSQHRAGTLQNALSLPVGQPAEMALVIQGPAAPNDFFVEWAYDRHGKTLKPGTEGVDARATGGFSTRSGAPESLLSFSLTRDCLDLAMASKKGAWFDRTPVRVGAEVKQRSDGRVVAVFGFGEFIPVATIKQLNVITREGGSDGTIVDSFPLFLPGDAKHHQKAFALRLDLDSGDRLVLPLNAVAQPRPGTLVFSIDGSNGAVIFNMAARGRTGWDELVYRITAEQAERMHVNLADGLVEARLQLSINRLELWKRGTGARMTVFGPESERMEGYAVTWKTSTGEVTTPFKREGVTFVCDSPADILLIEAILLNPRGAECGVVRADTTGKQLELYDPDTRPVITINTPAPMKAGAIVSLQAQGSGLPLTGPLSFNEAEYTTVWKVTGPLAKVRTVDGKLIPQGRDRFVAIGHIELLRNVPVGGADIPITMELYRKTSWREAKPQTQLVGTAKVVLRALHNPSLPAFVGQVQFAQPSSDSGQSAQTSQWIEGPPEVALERMTPLQGNNPFNTQNPIVNTTINGVTYTSTETIPVTSLPEPPKPATETVAPPPPAPPQPGNPSITTSAADKNDGDRVLPAAGGTIVDTVTYANLTPGTLYTLNGTVMDKTTGQTTGITTQKTFTPNAATGQVTQEFVIAAAFAGKTLVVFERLSDAGGQKAEHANLNDAAQTVSVQAQPAPTLSTTAKDKTDQDKTLPSSGGTIVDTVTYANLIPGAAYTLNGELMDKATGLTTGITAQKNFTPNATSGSVDQEYTVTNAQAGKTLVVYERLSDATGVRARHENLNDAAQTITVEAAQAITGVTGSIGFANVNLANPTIHMACILLDPNTDQGSLSAGGGQMGNVNRVFDIHVTPTYNIGDGDPWIHFERAQANSGSVNWKLSANPEATNTLFYNTAQNISVFNVNTRVKLLVEQNVAGGGGAKLKLELTVTRNGNGTTAGDYQLVVHTAEYVN